MSMPATFAAWRVAALVSLALIAALVPGRAAAQALKPVGANPIESFQIERKFRLGRDCLHVEQSRTGVATATCMAVGLQQNWMFRKAPGAPYLQYQLVNVHTGGCLDVEGGSTSQGARAVDWPCHGGINQQWRLLARHESDISHVQLQSVQTGLCVEVENRALFMRDCVAEAGGVPVFSLVGATQRIARQSPNGSPIQGVRSGRCVGQNPNGFNTSLNDCAATGTRFWFESERLAEGTFRLATSKALSHCAVVQRGQEPYHHDYTVVMRSCAEARANGEVWRLDASNGAWQYRHMPTGRCLDVRHGNTFVGASLMVSPCAPASDSARWYYAAH